MTRTPDPSTTRVLVLAPLGRDGPAIAGLLRQADLSAVVCSSVVELVAALDASAEVAVIAEEAVLGTAAAAVQAWVARQPPWSDMPFVVLTSQDKRPTAARERLVRSLGNVSLLERPVQTITLLSAVLSGVRARRRQYEVRSHLEEREHTERELEGLVATRTAELQEANHALRAEMEERGKAEEALRHARKMQALGQLTGGIAHDFNNMLRGVTGGLDLARRRIAEGRPGDAARYIDAAQEAAGRAATLTRRLLAFARRQPLDARPVDLDTLIGGMADLVRRTVGPQVEVVRMDDGSWPVLCDANQMQSALLNLAINARDAMPEGGTLQITTRDVRLGPVDLVGHEDVWAGSFVEVEVTDTGGGIPREVVARVFEPFFTTKPAGCGTGLGLSQVYGFVRQSGGLVKLESTPGRGTTVRLFLPRYAGPRLPSHAQAADNQTPLSSPSAGTVLLVEDEAAVRAQAAEALRETGYDVLEAGDGAAALAVLRGGVVPDALVTDVGLPGTLNGRQVAEAAREIAPDLPVLFITGYTGGALGAGALPRGMMMLGKPFELDALVRAVSRALARRASIVDRNRSSP